MPNIDFHLDQLPGEIGVAGDENRLGDAQIVDRQVEETFELLIAVLGEFQAVVDLFADLFAQPLLDDVAHVLEVDRIVDDHDRAAPIFRAQAITT
ncbi:hypothetical protein D9M72_594250 [compost metagenome]